MTPEQYVRAIAHPTTRLARFSIRDLALASGVGRGSAARWLASAMSAGLVVEVERGAGKRPSVFALGRTWDAKVSVPAAFTLSPNVQLYATVDADSIREYMPDVPYLLPASSWAGLARRRGRTGLPAAMMPDHVTHESREPGGFVATFRHGDYLYTPDEYVEWCHGGRPVWCATMDYCCEDEITGDKPGIVVERQQRTEDMAWRFFTAHRDVPWPWVPTIQGWTVADYVRHARQMRRLVERMQAHYGRDSAFRVGIGTLCKRTKVGMMHQIVDQVTAEMPPGTRIHLWGVSLGFFKSRHALNPSVISFDTSSYNGTFGSNLPEIRAERARRGMTQREHRYQVALPEYQAKLDRAFARPRQPSLFHTINDHEAA